MSTKMTYRDAGVDIKKAERSLKEVKGKIAETHNKNVLKNIGAFGGFYDISDLPEKNPVLISSADGVGTKLKVAVMMGKHDTVGQDLVNHCIDDIAVCGARPLFFLDYFATGALDESVYIDVISGFAHACKSADVPLIGGETAEMPDLYNAGEYDLAGTIVGVVDKHKIIDGSAVREGDAIIGVSSNGLHTNGFSLARKVLFSKYKVDEKVGNPAYSIGDELLKIHINYYPVIREMTDNFDIHGMAHITGGGLFNNTIRVVPDGLTPEFNWREWDVPPIFNLIQETGKVPEDDMRQTFNLGIGLVFILPVAQADNLVKHSAQFPQKFYRIGEIKST